MKAIYSFLECGIPENGMARVAYHLYHTKDITGLLQEKPEAIKASCSECKLPGFNVHVRGQIDGADGDAIESIARYMSRAAISVDKVEFNPEDNTLTVYERKDRPSSCIQATYTIMEFIGLLAAHILSPYESLVYYYGIYSRSHRGKERRVCPKTGCLPPLPVGKPTRRFKIGKLHPYPPLTTGEKPQKP